MNVIKPKKPFSKRIKRILIGLFIFIVVAGGGTLFTVQRVYNQNLQAVDPSSDSVSVVVVESGSSRSQISSLLKEAGVIRATWAFEQYVRSHEYSDKLQAGTYRFKKSQSVSEIVRDMMSGNVAVDLFTILPGQRLDQTRARFIEAGFDAASVDDALNPANYAGMAALADKPAASSLEGYLYPDSFQKTADTLPSTIIRASLAEMGDALTPEIRAGIAKQGLSVHQGIILASIIEKEIPSSSQQDRYMAAQVFLKRYKTGMMLGSDVTACYGAELANIVKEDELCDEYVYYESPYNTRIHTGLPPGPIANVSKGGLQAIANPSTTDYLFFVAGSDCVTRFSNTNAEHDALVKKYGLSTTSGECN